MPPVLLTTSLQVPHPVSLVGRPSRYVRRVPNSPLDPDSLLPSRQVRLLSRLSPYSPPLRTHGLPSGPSGLSYRPPFRLVLRHSEPVVVSSVGSSTRVRDPRSSPEQNTHTTVPQVRPTSVPSGVLETGSLSSDDYRGGSNRVSNRHLFLKTEPVFESHLTSGPETRRLSKTDSAFPTRDLRRLETEDVPSPRLRVRKVTVSGRLLLPPVPGLGPSRRVFVGEGNPTKCVSGPERGLGGGRRNRRKGLFLSFRRLRSQSIFVCRSFHGRVTKDPSRDGSQDLRSRKVL